MILTNEDLDRLLELDANGFIDCVQYDCDDLPLETSNTFRGLIQMAKDSIRYREGLQRMIDDGIDTSTTGGENFVKDLLTRVHGEEK